jgi:XisH protein
MTRSWSPLANTALFVDLGAERLLAAERGTERIAVEVTSFVGRSVMADLEQALGQFVLYRGLLRRSDPDRQLLLAIPKAIHESLLISELGRLACEEVSLTMLVFDPSSEVILQWFR